MCESGLEQHNFNLAVEADEEQHEEEEDRPHGRHRQSADG